MKENIITSIFTLLLFATAVLSCSVKDFDKIPGEELSITVTGTASDIDTGLPVEEIKITLHSSEDVVENDKVISEKSVYTDNDGKFTIMMSGFSEPSSFTITAEDSNGIYESDIHEIPLVTWESEYNVSGGMFFVNGCDFYLKKIQ